MKQKRIYAWKALLPRLSRADVRHLIWLALTGNVVYFALVATSVQWIGMAVTSLIVGLVPVTCRRNSSRSPRV